MKVYVRKADIEAWVGEDSCSACPIEKALRRKTHKSWEVSDREAFLCGRACPMVHREVILSLQAIRFIREVDRVRHGKSRRIVKPRWIQVWA